MSKEQRFSVGDRIRFLHDAPTHGKKAGDICEIKQVYQLDRIFPGEWAYTIDNRGWWLGNYWEKVEEDITDANPDIINKILGE